MNMMKKTTYLVALTIALFGAAAAFAAPASLQVTLAIAPNTTLPGLSVPLSLHVENGASAMHLGPSLRVRLTSPSGESFFADWGEGVNTGELELGLTSDDDPSLTVPANSALDLGVPAADLSRPSWALDRRMLALPGDWTLQVYLYSDDATNPVAVSNIAKLTIRTPSGDDFPIWQAIQKGEYPGIAQKVAADQKGSRYFPYLATVVARRAITDKISIISQAIAAHPDSPAVPSLHAALASYYASEADRVFFQEHDLEKAVSLADKGRAELGTLKNGKDNWGKLKANAQLADFPSRDYFVTLQTLQREKATKKP